VLAALHGRDRGGFGAACSGSELVEHLSSVAGGSVVRLEDGEVTVRLTGTEREQGAAAARLRAAAFALGWPADDDVPSDASVARFRRATP
jgi:hypothetical protein